MDRFKIIHNQKDKAYYLVDTVTGACVAESENPETLKRKKKELDHWHEV